MDQVLVEKLVYANSSSGGARVSAMVGNEPLWFESVNTELRLSPEGFGSALLVPAMSHGRDLVFEDPLCPVWLSNVQKLMGYFSKWWGWKPIKIQSILSSPAPDSRPGTRRVLCFSGGVDSFYSLLTYPQPLDTLVLVHGYDIALADEEGARIVFAHVQQVAAAANLDAALVRTNYREHPISGKKYRYAYGGAMAAIGHLLNQTGELVISSGLPSGQDEANGSRWDTDPLWSSSAMTVVNYGSDLTKNKKIAVIAANPLVCSHLRVCQDNVYGAFEISGNFLNCGCCQKCVRTLLVLQQHGPLGDFVNFANKSNLDIHLGRVMQLEPVFYKAYADIVRRGVDCKTADAIHALIWRSKVLNRLGWAGRRVRKAVFKVLRLLDALERKPLRRGSGRRK